MVVRCVPLGQNQCFNCEFMTKEIYKIFRLLVLIVLLAGCSPVKTSVSEQSVQSSASLMKQTGEDNQGLSYLTVTDDHRLKLVELVTKRNSTEQLLIKWTLQNTEPQYPIDEVYVNVTILDHSEQAIENWSTRASTNMSDDLFYLDLQPKTTIDQVGSYILEWQGMPERKSYDAPRSVHKPSVFGLKDNLGIVYILEASDSRLQLSKIEAIKNEQGILEIIGELVSINSDVRINEAAITIKLYEEMGQSIGGFSVLAQVEVDEEKLRFQLDTGLSVEKVKRYSLEWNGPAQ